MTLARLLAPLLSFVLLWGCGDVRPPPTLGGSPGPGGPPATAVSTPTPTPLAAADGGLVLRYACQIGPVAEPPDRSCFGPTFSLYADGTVVWRDATEPWADRADGRRYPGYETVRLNPAAVRALLDEVGPAIRTVTADPGTPPSPDEPVGDPPWWDVVLLDDGGPPIELRPGQGPLPRQRAELAGLGAVIRRLEAWRSRDADRATRSSPTRPSGPASSRPGPTGRVTAHGRGRT